MGEDSGAAKRALTGVIGKLLNVKWEELMGSPAPPCTRGTDIAAKRQRLKINTISIIEDGRRVYANVVGGIYVPYHDGRIAYRVLTDGN